MMRRAVTTLCAGLMAATPALACTDVRLMAGDGSPMSVRTMEFAMDLATDVAIVPRGLKMTSPAPQGDGLAWTSKYGFVAMNAFDEPVATDGLNEKGLGFGALYLPGETKYEEVGAGEQQRALSNARFGNWVLGNFATVDEVRDALKDVVVWGETIPQLGSFAPLHYSVHDASGKSLVIEFVDGKAHVYDNTVGVLTNSPTYDWHLQNLRNYVNLTAVNAAPIKIGKVTYAGTGQGSGLRGLPGDPTPPSRFVMAAATSYLADKPKDAAEALIVAEHLINRVDIPKGLVRDYANGGKPMGDYTQWTTFRDHANKVYFWKTYNDPSLRSVDLKTLDFEAGQPIRSLAIAAAKPTVRMMSTADFPTATQ
ncbi:MAG: choloylglycine hydrolase family protein [Hyphomicrobium sp.]|jgi:choloylglycine hydrolase